MAYAEFLHRHRDPEARSVYERLLASADGPKKSDIARRLVLLNLVATIAILRLKFYEVYKGAGGGDFTPSVLQSPGQRTKHEADHLHSRTAAVLRPHGGAVARSSAGRSSGRAGTQRRHERLPGVASSDSLDQTEYLKLVFRYLSQARELEKLAPTRIRPSRSKLRIAADGDLLRSSRIPYARRLRSEVVLETVNATRAFLTIDSGFPLAQLEQALRTNRPFAYDFQPAQVPVLYGPEYWLGAQEKAAGEFIESSSPTPRVPLYLGLSKLDPETAEAAAQADAGGQAEGVRARARFLRRHVRDPQRRRDGSGRRKGMASLDRTGIGQVAERWRRILRAKLTRDDGWVAALLRCSCPHQRSDAGLPAGPEADEAFLHGDARTHHQSRTGAPGVPRQHRSDAADQRLRIDPNGKPHIPGNLEVWKNLFINHPHGKYDGKLTKAATGWKEPDDVIEALFALCRKAVENEPLKIFMAVSDMNRIGAKPLEARDGRPAGARVSPDGLAVLDLRGSSRL